jgi:hypothetical protein
MKSVPFSLWRALLVAFGFTLIAACGSNPITNLFSGKEKDDPNAPEEEDRISILALEEQLAADPRYAGVTIDIPPAYVNASWTQPGGEADHTLHHLSAPLELKKIWTAARPSSGARG